MTEASSDCLQQQESRSAIRSSTPSCSTGVLNRTEMGVVASVHGMMAAMPPPLNRTRFEATFRPLGLL
jgi:hypothetical protein